MIITTVDGRVIDFRSYKDNKSSEATTAWARARLTWSEYSGKQPSGEAKYTDQYADVVVFGPQAEGMVTRYEKLTKSSDVHLVANGRPKAGEPWKSKDGKYKSNMEVVASNWNMIPLAGSTKVVTSTEDADTSTEASAGEDSEDYFG